MHKLVRSVKLGTTEKGCIACRHARALIVYCTNEAVSVCKDRMKAVRRMELLFGSLLRSPAHLIAVCRYIKIRLAIY